LETKTFAELGLSQKVQAAIVAAGYTTPTPIQAAAIPIAVTGRDVLGIAQTGTGQTASFVLPMITRLETGRARARMPRSLILAPTRELAAQCAQSFEKYGVNHKLDVALLIGGMSMDEQVKKLDRGVDVLIATPGRLLDHFQRGRIMLMGVEILVIDEADRMLDMGFIPDIEKICKLLPPRRQTLFFSATMPPEITRLVAQFLKDPERVEVTKAATTATTITQRFKYCPETEDWAKREMLRQLIGSENVRNAIIFCNRKRDVAILLKSLLKHGFNAGALHGDMDQKNRMDTLDKFRSGEITLLAASDVAARGLDIPDVSHVFNFDLPWQSDDYVHRIGRTGRAGKEGTSLSIVTPEDLKSLKDIEKMLGEDVVWIGDGPSEQDYADAGKKRRGRGGRSGARRPDAGPRREGRPERGAQGRRPSGAHDRGSQEAPARERPAHNRVANDRVAHDRGANDSVAAERAAPERAAAAPERVPQDRPERRPSQRTEPTRGQGPQPAANHDRQHSHPPRRDHHGAARNERSAEKAPAPPRERQSRTADQASPAAGFADNVPAFLRKPPRPLKVASE
jgi:superfamily II DNA/RNA helicase